MKSPSGLFVTFVVLFDILAFGLNFLILANGSRSGDLLFIAASDGALALSFTILGLFLTITMGVVLWRGRVYATRRPHRIEETEDRPRITGE
jgi:hypothetical protein